jgi:putative transposase
MKFGFIAKHQGVWPIRWLCEALGVSQRLSCLAVPPAQ